MKAARPGLTPLEYKSLLVNSAAAAFPGLQQSVQDAGAGMLDLNAAVLATVAANPTSLSFGVGPGTASLAATVRLSNLGYGGDEYRISVAPTGSSPGPIPAVSSVALAAGTYSDVSFSFAASNLAAGAYGGFIVVQGANAGTVARIPYWYGVASPAPAHLTILYVSSATATAGKEVDNAIWFRVTDAAGIIVSNAAPTVTASAGGGAASWR